MALVSVLDSTAGRLSMTCTSEYYEESWIEFEDGLFSKRPNLILGQTWNESYERFHDVMKAKKTLFATDTEGHSWLKCRTEPGGNTRLRLKENLLDGEALPSQQEELPILIPPDQNNMEYLLLAWRCRYGLADLIPMTGEPDSRIDVSEVIADRGITSLDYKEARELWFYFEHDCSKIVVFREFDSGRVAVSIIT
jgi:hypothetical protein